MLIFLKIQKLSARYATDRKLKKVGRPAAAEKESRPQRGERVSHKQRVCCFINCRFCVDGYDQEDLHDAITRDIGINLMKIASETVA